MPFCWRVAGVPWVGPSYGTDHQELMKIGRRWGSEWGQASHTEQAQRQGRSHAMPVPLVQCPGRPIAEPLPLATLLQNQGQLMGQLLPDAVELTRSDERCQH